MSSMRPYLIRGLYQWLLDNHQTPLLLVDCSVAGVKVPEAIVRDQRTVLNLSTRASSRLSLVGEQISGTMSFRGVLSDVEVPMDAVRSLYSLETGAGMAFEASEELPPIMHAPVALDANRAPATREKPSRPNHLRVVK